MSKETAKAPVSAGNEEANERGRRLMHGLEPESKEGPATPPKKAPQAKEG